jgi:chromosome partitioning protein
MHIAAICNQKGGTGKTTLTINLGAALADLGRRVLLVDLDPQGHLTEGVGLQDRYLEKTLSLHAYLVGKKSAGFAQLVCTAPGEEFAVIPANYELMLTEQALYMARNREHKLRGYLAQLEGQFDWVLIDCPPVLGNLTDNALNAARRVIVPVQAEATSVRALELLFDQIESLEDGLNVRISVLAVVPNLVQDSTLSKRILADLHGAIPEMTPFQLRKRVLLQAAWEAGHSIFGYHPTAAAEQHIRRELIDAYHEFAAFVLTKGEQEEHG